MHDTIFINQISYDLEKLLQDCWHRLINGANSAKNAFHTASVATINKGMPEIRTVVLRKAVPEEQTLIFHTDYRSPKLSQIRNNKAISWLFYDEKARIQLRIKSLATIHHKDELSLKRWNESRLESRKCYLVQPAPSTQLTYPSDGLAEHISNAQFNEESLAPGYENFVVVSNQVFEIDWLFLNHGGHRRAKFVYEPDKVNKSWLVP